MSTYQVITKEKVYTTLSQLLQERAEKGRGKIWLYSISSCFGYYSQGMKTFSNIIEKLKEVQKKRAQSKVELRILLKIDNNPIDAYAVKTLLAHLRNPAQVVRQFFPIPLPETNTNGSFDVFLSHNSKDKPTVRELAQALQARGLKVWLDEKQLVPGRPWQEALEAVIHTIKTAAVLVGKDGLGPWQDPEMHACLSEFVDRRLPVIPVLLPGAPVKPKLPMFLRTFTWVDLRDGLTDEGLRCLKWGITGANPEQPPGSVEDESRPTHAPFQSAVSPYVQYVIAGLDGEEKLLVTDPQMSEDDSILNLTQNILTNASLYEGETCRSIIERYLHSFNLEWEKAKPIQRVIIVHGRSNDWREVQTYVKNTQKLFTVELVQEGNYYHTFLQELRRESSPCSLALIIITEDDGIPGGHPMAWEKLMHEIGRFQGRLGLKRIVILFEKDVNVPTDIPELACIPYSKGCVKETFSDLERSIDNWCMNIKLYSTDMAF